MTGSLTVEQKYAAIQAIVNMPSPPDSTPIKAIVNFSSIPSSTPTTTTTTTTTPTPIPTPSPTPTLTFRLREKRPDEDLHDFVKSRLVKYDALSTDKKALVDLKVRVAMETMKDSDLYRATTSPSSSTVKDRTGRAFANLSTNDKAMWSAFLSDYHGIVLSEDNDMIQESMIKKNVFVVPVANPNAHSYTLGIPVKMNNGNMRELKRIDQVYSRGDTLTRQWKALRRATEEEVRAYYLETMFGN